MSIHKSQGQTLERVKVDLARIFEKGQAYVALSRATSLEGLQVLGFDPAKVRIRWEMGCVNVICGCMLREVFGFVGAGASEGCGVDEDVGGYRGYVRLFVECDGSVRVSTFCSVLRHPVAIRVMELYYATLQTICYRLMEHCSFT